MLQIHFLDTDDFQFTSAERSAVASAARTGDALARRRLPLAGTVHLLVEGSPDVLGTGDNAATVAPHLIRWWADPARDIAAVARAHLAAAFAHEAFHAARFRRLGREAGSRSWLDIAIGEGLATAFARDAAGAQEPWASYDPAVIGAWAAELVNQPDNAADLVKWKFRHPDGREWIAFRVGTWIIDSVRDQTGKSAADLVWTPADEIIAMSPAVAGLRKRSSQ